MSNILYMQTDPRWSKMSYGRKTTMGAAGCGCCALANLLQVSPLIIRDWMITHSGMDDELGTYHTAIFKCVQAYGFDSAKITTYSHAGKKEAQAFDTALRHLKDGEKMVFLMGGKASGCLDSWWCGSGHYITVDGYKETADGIFLHVMDSYYAAHNGWIAWKNFLGDIKHLFTTSVRWREEDDDMKDFFEGKTLVENNGPKYAGVRRVVSPISVHTAPDPAAPRLTAYAGLSTNNLVDYTGYKYDNNWAQVRIAGKYLGWVDASKLSANTKVKK